MVVTCKTTNAVYQHIGIKKENPRASNTFTKCTTGKLVFENLNESIINYLMAYPKFQYGDHSAPSDYLDPRTRPNPKMDLFALCLNDYV
ncbi:hypothetical protein BJ944DRAFT_241061 [Cunninghamella echinulata]|nr:hypothetical protein BJ944DRAFT_241061 [Cunninghamella echinulata]